MVEEAEQRIDQLVLQAGIKELEADWASIKFELKRLRNQDKIAMEKFQGLLNG